MGRRIVAFEVLLLEILEVLDDNDFKRFKWFLRHSVNLEGLQPLPKSLLKDADKMKTVGLIKLNYSSKATCITVEVLRKIGRISPLHKFLEQCDMPKTYKAHNRNKSYTLEDRILETLDHVEEKFKLCLGGLKAIPSKELREADKMDTVDLIMQYYPDDAEQTVVNVLHEIDEAEIAQEMFPDTLKSTGSNKKKRKRNQEEPKDDPNASTSTIPHDPDASTSTIPRKWLPVSKRWRPQLKKLVIMDDSKVKKVKSLVFGEGTEFRIGEGSNGVEVFLGLRDDGTEVAVKRMSKTHNLYNDLKNDELYLRLPELDDPSIVRYVDFVEDKDYGYLALQLCEDTLNEEYITKLPEQERKQLAKQVLNSLRILHCQDLKILHRDIKPQNVLIDIQGKARLADFGLSRRIDKGKTTRHTSARGTPCWMAKETLDKSDAAYKRSTDIQPSGMLIYYILSGGHHPFGQGIRCEVNISEDKHNLDHVDDMVAKSLVEWMIHGEPEKRPTVQQCLAHPFFWPNKRREEYLRRIGNEKEVEKNQKAEERALDQYAEQGQFNAWKQKFQEADEKTRQLFEEMDGYKKKRGPDGKPIKKFYSDNSFGLLRFIRNLHAHYPEEAAGINLMEMFPALFGYVHKFAKEQGWNSSRPALKDMSDF